jgi:cell division protein ZapE
MTPLDYYREKISQGWISEDAAQLAVFAHLDKIHYALIQEHKKRRGFLSALRKPHLVQGLYLWGGVGIGKTFLMDCFYHCLPFAEKQRMHFHSFMRWVHQALKKHQGKQDPLTIIAKELGKQTQVLCFDEFYVSDITDAMLLGRLFKALFAEGVCLVTTSNIMPDDLYKNGLQRGQFLPAIALLKQHTNVMHIPTVIDYRLRHLKEAGVFYTPNDALAHEQMQKSFDLLAHHREVSEDAIDINGRFIPVKKKVDDIVWFDFDVICSVPRSQHDYLAIAEQFRTVFISNIPIIPPHAKNMISLFIRLVDVFYDARVRFIFSAEKPVRQIYSQGDLHSDYLRTASRLLEMQSESYFSYGLNA